MVGRNPVARKEARPTILPGLSRVRLPWLLPSGVARDRWWPRLMRLTVLSIEIALIIDRESRARTDVFSKSDQVWPPPTVLQPRDRAYPHHLSEPEIAQ